MATYTTKLGLRIPQRLGPDDIVDVVADINTNMDLLDQYVNLLIATSGARPANPFTGVLIYETDAGNIMLYNGTSWESYGKSTSSKGRIVYGTSTSNGSSLTSASAEELYLGATFTAESTRRYWVETDFWTECVSTTSAPGQINARVRWASGGSVVNTDTQLGSDMLCGNVQGTGGANTEHFHGVYEFVPGVSGSVTVGLFGSVPFANDTMRFGASATDRINKLIIRDVGV